TLDLTINYTVNSTDVNVACDTYTWIDGTNYVVSNNTATHTIVGGSSLGCDSIVTLNLTINPTVNSTDVQTACTSYTWIDGTNYIASNNTATHTVVGGSYLGCDSIITLDLTINYTVNSTDVNVACDSYTWIDGVVYTASNTTATFTIANGAASGCDSIVTLDLTINYTVNSTDVNIACDTYTWIDGNNYVASNNTATHTIGGGSYLGCDSIITLDLTINYTVNSTDVNVACDSYTWIDGVVYTASNTTATFTIANGAASGCDSIVTLDLTINSGTINAVNDYITTALNTGVQIDPLANDNGVTVFTVITNPINGTTSGSIFYTPNQNYNGLDSMTYEICDLLCVTICDTATIFIEITPERDIAINNGFSPNDDGINETFEIGNIEFYPDNELTIYNRWGDQVYAAQPYNNEWDGSTEATGVKLSGDKVTDGTYYFILKLTPDSEPINGFIDLRR
ncbi:MAG: gliding motility-associated C-terminal domain-containing protein, partial [Vicingaceae bacterium]